MRLREIASKMNEALSKDSESARITCICMHQYTIEFYFYEFMVQVATEVEIVTEKGTTHVSADYLNRTDESSSIVRFVGRDVLRCRFDDAANLLFEVDGGEIIRCVATEPTESFSVTGLAGGTLCLP